MQATAAPLENGSDAGMCSSTAMPWTARPLTGLARQQIGWSKACEQSRLRSNRRSRPNPYMPGAEGQKSTVDRRFGWSDPMWSPPPESNRRPHPYHGSAAKRRAMPHLRRSTDTVDVTVMGSVTSGSRARAGFESSTFHQRRLIQTLDVLGVGSEVLVEPAGPVSGGGFWLLR